MPAIPRPGNRADFTLESNWRAAVASAPAVTIAPDTVVTFQINPGTLLQFLEARAEGGPRLKCFEGSVTLVSPRMPHEMKGCRLKLLILAVCPSCCRPKSSSSSTTRKSTTPRLTRTAAPGPGASLSPAEPLATEMPEDRFSFPPAPRRRSCDTARWPDRRRPAPRHVRPG